MRGPVLAIISAVLALFAPAAVAEDAPANVKGIYLLTDYPETSVRPGATSTINLRLQNYASAPERYALTVAGAPTGWTVQLLGGGAVVMGAMAPTNGSVALQLRLDVPADATGKHTIQIDAAPEGAGSKITLPIVAAVTGKDQPAKLTLEPRLPSVRGNVRASFEFQVAVKNDSGQNLVVGLGAQAPPNFETSFTEAYGSQELSSIPIEAGQTKDVKLRVRPPNTSKAGKYPVMMRVSAEGVAAVTKIELDITGQPQLSISGRDGILSARATAGIEKPIPIVVMNSGTAPAEQVELAGSGPSGWKISFDPKAIEGIAPDETKEAQALITPPAGAIAGDYQASLRATTRGENASANFRVTVETSTLWGLWAIGIIAVALLILVGAVARFGRR